MTSARNIYVRFKSKLAVMLFTLAKAISAPAEETKADRQIGTKSEAKADAVSISDTNSKKHLKMSLLAKAVAYIRAPVAHARNIFFRTKSKIDAAQGSVCKTDAETFSFDLKAKANSSDGEETNANRNLSTFSVSVPTQNAAAETNRKAVCKLDMSAELFHAITCGADFSQNEIVTHKASPRYWMMPYVDENGILHIRQAYQAQVDENHHLEVR